MSQEKHRMRRARTGSYWARGGAAALALGAWLCGSSDSLRAAETELLGAQAPWRAYLVTAAAAPRDEKGGAKGRGAPTPAGSPAQDDPARYQASPLPPTVWMKADFDDGCWARYQEDLPEFLSVYGIPVGSLDNRTPWPALLCLRSCFGIADPARAADLKVVVSCLGGAVAYVNGQEIGRGAMPAGPLGPMSHAEAYPVEAYTTDDGKTPLPSLSEKGDLDAKWAGRYEKRIRTFEFSVPARALVKGRNVLAVDLRRAAAAGPMAGRGWSHLGLREIRVTSASGAGAIPYADAIKGTHVWSANAVDQVAETLSPKSLIKRGWFWTFYVGRGLPVKGVQQGNPFDPVLPVKLTMPRNGVGSGQTVLSDPAGLRGVSAALGPLKGPGGAALPAGAVQIRFAAQHPGVHYCDALMEKPPDGAKTVPVWLIVQAPKDQAPGWYAGTLSLDANGKKFSVPVQALVTGLVLPNAKDFASSVGLTHSPDTVAKHYNVELWSDAHMKLMSKSLALLGQVGNDVVHVPALLSGVGGAGKSGVRLNWQPLIRWVKTDAGLKPDFTILEKYLDAYTKHCAPPRALSLYVWGASSAKEIADAYENRRIPSRENTKYSPPKVALWDPKTGTVSEHPAPIFGDDGSEAFWKALIDGVRAIAVKRGWPERVVMLGLGGDIRPGQKTADLLKQWAPYARWDFLSHFSGDPAPKDGRMIATGGMEIGMMEWPHNAVLSTLDLEARVKKPYDFLELPTARWVHQPYSPPLIFRTMAATWGCLGRVGLDFWLASTDRAAPRTTSFFSHVETLTVPGTDGAIPTVRFQMLREGIQDAEVRSAMIAAYLKLPEEQRKPHRALLDELLTRIGRGSPFILSQSELSYDWPAYVAQVHLAAAELAGAKTGAKWDEPPKP
jgi:hypothetical protein